MKSTIILFFAAAILFSACSSPSTENETTIDKVKEQDAYTIKKYQLKSATITYQTAMKAAGYEGVGKSIVYFDDYGNKERKDSYDEEGNLKETFFSDGKTLYLLIHKNKAAFNRGSAYRGTEFKFDWNEIPSKDKESGKAKKAANETIAGKDCEVFHYGNDQADSKYAGWKNICLYTEVVSSGTSSIIKAVEIKEGPVPAEMFAIPAGYTAQ